MESWNFLAIKTRLIMAMPPASAMRLCPKVRICPYFEMPFFALMKLKILLTFADGFHWG